MGIDGTYRASPLCGFSYVDLENVQNLIPYNFKKRIKILSFVCDDVKWTVPCDRFHIRKCQPSREYVYDCSIDAFYWMTIIKPGETKKVNLVS